MSLPPNTVKVNNTGGSTGKRATIAAAGLVVASLGVFIPSIQKNEGLSLEAYPDVAKKWTYCYGETLKPDGTAVKKGDRATFEECLARLHVRGNEFMTKVATLIKPPLYADTGYYLLAAHTHFAYNVGIASYKSSRTLTLTNAGDFVKGCEAMASWNGLTINGVLYNCNRPDNLVKINGCKGIVNRRNEEIAMCLKGAK